jgi:hypothetical protein
MKKHLVVVATLAVAFAAGSALAEGTVKSGPQVDEKLAGPFHPLNVTGSEAGKKNCLYCSNGDHPVAMIFARETSPELAKLIKKIDACTAKNEGCEMGSFVVFLNEDEEGLAKNLKEMAEKANLRRIVLSIDNPAGPKGYKVAKDADVTVVLYTNRTVKANYAFKKGELKDKDVEAIVGDVSKILPSK